jgi:hypothetical protein
MGDRLEEVDIVWIIVIAPGVNLALLLILGFRLILEKIHPTTVETVAHDCCDILVMVVVLEVFSLSFLHGGNRVYLLQHPLWVLAPAPTSALTRVG